jgi:hypothetical protein
MNFEIVYTHFTGIFWTEDKPIAMIVPLWDITTEQL